MHVPQLLFPEDAHCLPEVKKKHFFLHFTSQSDQDRNTLSGAGADEDGKATTAANMFVFEEPVLEVVSGRWPIEPRAASEELVFAERGWER